jgi:hypothetical protein
VRLKSGTWIGGAFARSDEGRRAYASGLPAPQDLYLSATVPTDPVTGEFEVDGEGNLRVVEAGLLLRWEEVEYLQFIDA